MYLKGGKYFLCLWLCGNILIKPFSLFQYIHYFASLAMYFASSNFSLTEFSEKKKKVSLAVTWMSTHQQLSGISWCRRGTVNTLQIS